MAFRKSNRPTIEIKTTWPRLWLYLLGLSWIVGMLQSWPSWNHDETVIQNLFLFTWIVAFAFIPGLLLQGPLYADAEDYEESPHRRNVQ